VLSILKFSGFNDAFGRSGHVLWHNLPKWEINFVRVVQVQKRCRHWRGMGGGERSTNADHHKEPYRF
jgi:hypothetical protein